jgi:predicted deacetylase
VKPGLLVVPDFHHGGELRADPGYARMLRGLADEGHELFLHGYFHRSLPGSGVGHFVAQKVVSAGEAEFASYDREVGERWLDAGVAMLRELGLPMRGFVPPAWARRSWLMPALAARGLDYTEDQLFIYEPSSGARRLCPALNYASRTLVGRLYPRAGVPVRVALHPADVHHAMLVDETRSLLAWARGRTTDRVGDLFTA